MQEVEKAIADAKARIQESEGRLAKNKSDIATDAYTWRRMPVDGTAPKRHVIPD